MKIKIANVYFLIFVIVVSLIIYQLVPNFTPLENLIRTSDYFSSRLPVTDLNEAPL